MRKRRTDKQRLEWFLNFERNFDTDCEDRHEWVNVKGHYAPASIHAIDAAMDAEEKR